MSSYSTENRGKCMHVHPVDIHVISVKLQCCTWKYSIVKFDHPSFVHILLENFKRFRDLLKRVHIYMEMHIQRALQRA